MRPAAMERAGSMSVTLRTKEATVAVTGKTRKKTRKTARTMAKKRRRKKSEMMRTWSHL